MSGRLSMTARFGFNPRPREEATALPIGCPTFPTQRFNPRPREEATGVDGTWASESIVSIHAPVRRRQALINGDGEAVRVSIHAPVRRRREM